MRSDRNKKKKHRNVQDAAIQADGTAVKTKTKRSTAKKIFLTLLILFFACCLAVAIYAGITIAKAPSIDVNEIYDILSESTVIYDQDGKEVDTVFSEENRTNVEFEKIPENMLNAMVALEDKTFWKHHGFNFIRILGAIKESVFGGGQISGTSTITQQLARNIFLKDNRFDHDMSRKIVEAYYTVIIESKLEKEDIITMYLNTVNFGCGNYGVQAAAQSYFSKDVQDLTLEECAALAAIPQSPSIYNLISYVGNEDISKKDKNILKRTANGTYIANDASKNRRETCLAFMADQGYISEEEAEKASSIELREMLNPSYSNVSEKSAYFEDYVIDQVIEDLMEEKDWDYDTAWDKVYNGGLKIYSTLDSQAQNVVEKEFDNDANFPSFAPPNVESYSSYFDGDGNFTLKTSEIKKKKDGSLIIRSGKRLNIYETEVNGKTDYSLEFKSMSLQENGKYYTISGGFINVPQQYKSLNKSGNLVISKDFFKTEEYKDFFIFNDDGTITIPASSYTLNQKQVQPQAAMTIVENSTGYIKAMVGGRQTSGRRLHNRATSPQQPGSSIKPLAVYSAAIAQSAEEAKAGKKHHFTDFGIDKQGDKLWGYYLTPASIVIDEKTTINGSVWPQNAGTGYTGPTTMRGALQSSINTCAVKIFLQVGEQYSADLVEKFGITTLDREGDVNDLNPAALALGGLTNGVSTLEMASAYTVFPNNGTRKETTSYTKVLDSKEEVLLDKTNTKTHEVLDAGVAWIMTDMLKSVVSQGIGGGASISGVQSGGKTGTTDNNTDIWFDGFTPSYSASLWIGMDQNSRGYEMSGPAAALWGRIMNQIENAKKGSYKSAPGNVVYSGGEYYISGTQGGVGSIKDLDKKVTICTETGYLACPDCPSTQKKTFAGWGDEEDEVPKYYCYKHNANPEKYPVNPKEKFEPFTPIKPEDPKEPEKPEKPEKPAPEPPVDPDPDPENPDEPDVPVDPAA